MTCCRRRGGTAWAPWSGARCRVAGSPASTARDPPAPVGSRGDTNPDHFDGGNEAKFDAVERLPAIAADAGMPLTHLALALAVEHPAVTDRARSGREPRSSSTTSSARPTSGSTTTSSTRSTTSSRPARRSTRPTSDGFLRASTGHGGADRCAGYSMVQPSGSGVSPMTSWVSSSTSTPSRCCPQHDLVAPRVHERCVGAAELGPEVVAPQLGATEPDRRFEDAFERVVLAHHDPGPDGTTARVEVWSVRSGRSVAAGACRPRSRCPCAGCRSGPACRRRSSGSVRARCVRRCRRSGPRPPS